MKNTKKNSVKLVIVCAIFALVTGAGCVVTTNTAGTTEPVAANPPQTAVPAPEPVIEPEPEPADQPEEQGAETPTPEETPTDQSATDNDRIGPPKLKTINGPFYKVKVRKKRSAGNNVVTRIIVTPKNEYHCNMEFPWKVTPSPIAGVKVKKRSYGKADAKVFTEPKVIFEIPYTAREGLGLKAKLRASLCNESQCETVKLDLTL